MRLFRFGLLIVLLALAATAQGTPFFARTYGFRCATCHSGFPRLNPFGLAFKANNFRIPGAEKQAPLAWQKTVPLAAQVVPTSERFSPGAAHAEYTDTQILAGGLLTRQTAFYVHHSLWIDDKPLEFPAYEAWVQQMLNERNKLLLKVGQFELPFAYSPGINAITVFSPLLLNAGVQGNDVRLGAPMRGLQLSGQVANRVRWSVASGAPSLLSTGNTVGEREFLGEFRDLFLRVSNANLTRNYGLFAYFIHPTRKLTDPMTREHGYRYGVDGALYWRDFRFYGMLVYGENSNPTGTGQTGNLRSGFVEVDRMLLPWLGLTGRWDIQSIHRDSRRLYADARTISLRLYPTPFIKVVAEYQQADHGRSSTALLGAVSF